MFRNILIFIVLLLSSFNCFSSYLVLKDGNIVKGELESLNKKELSLRLDHKIYVFKINDIDYLLVDGYKNEKYLDFILNNRKRINENVILIKSTNNVIYYYLPVSNLLKTSKIKEIDKLEYTSKAANNYSVEKYLLRKNSDITNEFSELLNSINRKKDNTNKEQSNNHTYSYNYNFIDIEANDFYEKYWAGINKFIASNTKNLIWNLFEIYSEKEKQLNIMFNEEILKSKTNEKITDLKKQIMKLRKDFFFRSKKIIYNSEFLTDTINNFK